MGRWHARLTELRGHSQGVAPVQFVQSVQHDPSGSAIEHNEHIEHGVEPWTDAHDERGAIIEHDGGAPKAWAEALVRLNPHKPPADVPPRRWGSFVDDCARFLDGGWAELAAAIGWGPLDLFGCDRERPFARIDRMGLLWLISGGTLIDLKRDHAIIETPNCSRQTFRRHPVDIGHVVLAWELVPQ